MAVSGNLRALDTPSITREKQLKVLHFERSEMPKALSRDPNPYPKMAMSKVTDEGRALGWTNDHKTVASKSTFRRMDHELFKMQWRWAKRRYSEKGAKWIKAKSFKTRGRWNWIFAGRGMDDRGIFRDAALMLCDEVKIRRHKKVKMGANPFDPAWDAYFENRQRERLLAKHQERSQNARLLKRQRGLCAQCGQLLTVETGYDKHHVVPRNQGGTNRDDNLVVIHPACHQAHHVHHPAERSVAGRSGATPAA